MVSPKHRSNPWLILGRYLSLAFVLPSAVAAGYIVGYLLDHWLGTTYLKVVFLLLGIAAGLLELLRQLSRNNHDSG